MYQPTSPYLDHQNIMFPDDATSRLLASNPPRVVFTDQELDEIRSLSRPAATALDEDGW